MVPQSEIEEAARAFAARFGEESFEDAADLLSADGRERVVESFSEEFPGDPGDAPDALKQYWWGLYGQYGGFEDVGSVSVEDNETAVELVFVDGSETATVEVDDDGVADLRFSPEYEVPAYVEEDAFTERGVTVDAGDEDLDGVLAVPEDEGPFPAVLLVHGAGIHDPDGTAGASKILKDVAWGLASEGVASLRYEKRLREHEVADEDYTLDAVVTDDAVAAASELAATDDVDEDALFVAGHSQGGMTAPRIAERHAGVAGVVNLDGRADSTLDPDDLAFMRYEFELDGDLDDEQEAQLEGDRETVRRIAEGDFEDDDTLWGRPGTWYRSVAGYDPSSTASSLDCPAFVAKTCRADEAVQPELVAWLRSEFEKWQSAELPDGSRVELYEGLDHYFQPGYAPATPLSIDFGGNVAECVVADLAEWVHDVAAQDD